MNSHHAGPPLSKAPPASSTHGHSTSVESGSTIVQRSVDDEVPTNSSIWSGTTNSPGSVSPKPLDIPNEDIEEAELHANVGLVRTESPLMNGNDDPPKEKNEVVSWKSLPRKGQLTLLMLARISEPLTQTSLQSYMYYQLQSFDPSLPDATIAAQVGILQGSFTAAQFLTAFLWGKIADSSRVGRKRVLVIGLLGTALSAAGFGFSRSFTAAIFFRCLGGALNGNVGVMRTMISEIIKEKKYQSRAFMILPMTFNIGVIIGPTLGGLLADPVTQYPDLFGENSTFGGKYGVWWMEHWPYALPNLISASFLFSATFLLILGLEETHYMRKDKPDWGREVGSWILKHICRRRPTQHYSAIPTDEVDSPVSDADVELQSPVTPKKPDPVSRRAKLPFRRIFTRNVCLTFLSHGLMAFHVGTFTNLWFTHLSAPRWDPNLPEPETATEQHPPFRFTGGFAMPPAQIGLSLSIIGVIGITLQLLVYPRVNARFGTTRCYKVALTLFPVAYLLAPYLSLLPSTSPPPEPASGFLIWAGISCLLFIQVMARTFALPANIILVNNSCPHPSVLGTIHGLGQSISSGMRTLGPVIGGWLFGVGLTKGIIGLAWWVFAIEAAIGFLAGTLVREGSGHEILLEGEEEEFEEAEQRKNRR